MSTKSILPHLLDQIACTNGDLNLLDFTDYGEEFRNKWKNQLSIAFDYHTHKQSGSFVEAFRTYVQNFVLIIDKLSPEFISYHMNIMTSVTDPKLQDVIAKVNKDVDTAKKAAKRPPIKNANYNLNSSFVSKLADKKSRDECFHEVVHMTDSIALNTFYDQQNTNCCAPLWDGDNVLLPAPLRIAKCTATKMSPVALRQLDELAKKTRRVFGTAIAPIIPKEIIDLDKRLIRRGQSLGALAHNAYCITDPYPYFQTKVNVSKLTQPIKDALSECLFAHAQFKTYYNPLDAAANTATASNPGFTISPGGCSFKVEWLGKQVRPLKKSKEQSIKFYLDYKESQYDWSDKYNWNLYPTTGDASKERSIIDVMIEKKIIKG